MRLGSKSVAAVVILAGILIMTMAGGALAAPPWPDAPNSWWVSSYGVTETEVATVADGYADGLFRPANSVTRGQFTKMAVNGLGVDTLDPAVATFRDVPKGQYLLHIRRGCLRRGSRHGLSRDRRTGVPARTTT